MALASSLSGAKGWLVLIGQRVPGPQEPMGLFLPGDWGGHLKFSLNLLEPEGAALPSAEEVRDFL